MYVLQSLDKSQKSKIVGAGFDQSFTAFAVNLFAKPARTKVKCCEWN